MRKEWGRAQREELVTNQAQQREGNDNAEHTPIHRKVIIR